MLSADGLAGGLMVQDRVHDLEGVGAIELLQDSRANASDWMQGQSPEVPSELLNDLFDGLLGEDLVAQRNALVADVHGRPGDELPDGILGLSAEGAAQVLVVGHGIPGRAARVRGPALAPQHRLQLQLRPVPARVNPPEPGEGGGVPANC